MTQRQQNFVSLATKLWPLVLAILAVGMGWATFDARLGALEDRTAKIDSISGRMIQVETLFTHHRSIGAHKRANLKLSELQSKISTLEAQNAELTRRIDALRRFGGQ